MGWLSDIERDFKYECIVCGELSIRTLKASDPSYLDDRLCSCGSPAKYAGFEPMELHLRTKVAFEHNGRKGYAISDGKGSVTYRSATRDHYEKTGDISPKYTPEYREALKKSGREDFLKEHKREDIIKSREATKEFSKKIKPVAYAEAGEE